MKKDGERKRKVYIRLSVTEYWCWNVPACWWEGLHLWTCCRCPLISERCLFGVGGFVIFRGFCSMCFLITLSHLIGLFFSIFRHLRCAFVDVRSRDARDLISVAKLFFSSLPSPIVALCCPLSFFSFFFPCCHSSSITLTVKSPIIFSPLHLFEFIPQPLCMITHIIFEWGGCWGEAACFRSLRCLQDFVNGCLFPAKNSHLVHGNCCTNKVAVCLLFLSTHSLLLRSPFPQLNSSSQTKIWINNMLLFFYFF